MKYLGYEIMARTADISSACANIYSKYMSWPKNMRNPIHVQLANPDKGRAIKWSVVCRKLINLLSLDERATHSVQLNGALRSLCDYLKLKRTSLLLHIR